MGSGTTALVCIQLNRYYPGMKILKEYYNLTLENIKKYEKLSDKGRVDIEHFISLNTILNHGKSRAVRN